MRYVIIALVLILASSAAWFFRYQPIMGSNGPAVWDRWTQRECDIKSVSDGYGCRYENAKAKAIIAAREAERGRQEAETARQEKSKTAANEISKIFPEQNPMWGLAGIETFRAAGFNEKEIAGWVMPLRQKFLAAGVAKRVVDDYFGGDPFIPRE